MLNNLEILLVSFALVCALTDILEEKIYNVITLPVLLGGVLYAAIGVFYPELSLTSVLYFGKYLGIGCVWFLIWFLLYSFRIVAGGDVKFFLAIYAWAGPPEIFLLSAYILIASGVLALVYLIEDGRLAYLLRNTLILIFSGVRVVGPDRHYQKPLGFAMLLGTLAYILWK